MKFLALMLLPMLSACSFLDELQINQPRTLDPSKIYLLNETVRANRNELDRYACLSGAPLFCDGSGTTLNCRC